MDEDWLLISIVAGWYCTLGGQVEKEDWGQPKLSGGRAADLHTKGLRSSTATPGMAGEYSISENVASCCQSLCGR